MSTVNIIPGYKYFESQENDEQVLLVIRRHWFVTSSPFVFGAFVLLFLLVLNTLTGIYFPDGQAIAAVIKLVINLGYLFTILFVFSAWLVLYLNLIILTTEHLVEIHQRGLFNREISELDLGSIQDATATQKGVLQTMFKFGTVFVQTAGELPNFNLTGIGNPNLIQQKIMEAKELAMKSQLQNINRA
jgi:hypothetical protein